MSKKKTVVIGLIGAVMDTGAGPERWQRWRPSIDVCRHEELKVERFELLYAKKFAKLAGQVTEDIATVSPQTVVKPTVVEFRDPWDFQEVYAALHDFARQYPFNPDKEDYLIHITTGTHVAQICLFLLTEAHYLPAKLIQTAPPPSHHRGQPGNFAIIDLDLSKYDSIASRFRQEKTESLSFLKSGIDTRNAQFNKLIEQIERVAIASKAPLLLMGPTGSGKSLLARRIYELKKSRRQINGPFVEINCATLRGDAAMSALFGHTKGAFTGAVQARPGLLRAADGGLLFLDEIGELGLDEQAMLLRALEEKVFLPVGADVEVKSNFQLIAGTNRDLMAEVHKHVAASQRDGRGNRDANTGFREDLLARINMWTFRMPALRQRVEDIEPNIAYELEQYAQRENINVTFNKEGRDRFVSFAKSSQALWTGNFRDLNGSIYRMATLMGGSEGGGRITLEIVEQEIRHLLELWKGVAYGGGTSDEGLLQRFLSAAQIADLDRFDRIQLEDVLRVCLESPTLSEAGRELFAASRRRKKNSNDADRLRKYLGRFGLEWNNIHK